MKSYSRTDEDLQKERKKAETRKIRSAGIVEFESIILFLAILSWARDNSLLKSGKPTLVIAYGAIALALFAIAVIIIRATIIHMNDYRELKETIAALEKSIQKEKESSEYWKNESQFWMNEARNQDKK